MGVRTSVLQVKICERTNPSRDVESDILIEAFEPIASQRFILITSIDEVAAAVGCQVEELQNNDKSDNVLWQHSIQGLNFVYDGESDQVALQLKAKGREDNAPTKSSILDLAINMIVEARGKGGQWAENKWSTARIVRCNVDGSSENQTFNIKFLSSGEEAIVTTANTRLPEEKIIEYVSKNTPGSKNDGKGNEEEMPSGEDAEAAAAKVQAYMRGKAAREQVEGMKATQESPVEAAASDADKQQPQPQEQKATEEEGEMPRGEDAEAAAAKVQAYMRGKVAREQVAGMKATQESPVEAGASDADKQQPQPQEQKATEEEEEMPSGED